MLKYSPKIVLTNFTCTYTCRTLSQNNIDVNNNNIKTKTKQNNNKT